jgi:hypothetical protein
MMRAKRRGRGNCRNCLLELQDCELRRKAGRR